MSKLWDGVCNFLDYCEKRGPLNVIAGAGGVVGAIFLALMGVIYGIANFAEFIGVDGSTGFGIVVLGGFALAAVVSIRNLIAWRRGK